MLDEYQIKMLAVQYKLLGFTNKQIADTFNRQGLLTPHKKRPFKEATIQTLTARINDQRTKRKRLIKVVHND